MNAYSTDLHGCQTKELKPREARQPTDLHGWFVRDTEETAWDFIISNLSYSGCRIRTAAPLQSGERIRLSVAKRGIIESTVVWRRGEAAGLAFAVKRAAPAQWPRKALRYETRLSVLVRQRGRTSQRMEALNISQVGCCLEFVSPPRAGELLWVQLRGLVPLAAEVRWVEGHQVGVAFAHAIQSIVFQLLIDQWKAAGALRAN
jgi:hypothetical protein